MASMPGMSPTKAAFRSILASFTGRSEHGQEAQADDQAPPREEADHATQSSLDKLQRTKRAASRVIEARSARHRCQRLHATKFAEIRRQCRRPKRHPGADVSGWLR